MQTLLNCSVCGKTFTAAAAPGAQVYCAHCGTALMVPAGAPPTSPSAAALQYTPPPSRPQRQGLAVAALVLGILGMLCLLPFGGIVAIVLGAVALSQARRQPDEYGGRGLAVAGVTLGVLATMLTAVGAVALVAGWPKITRFVCEENLRTLHSALRAYADEWEQAFPPDFEALVEEGYASEDDFYCVGRMLSQGLHECYEYVPGQVPADDPANVLIHEKPRCHSGQGGNVLLLNGDIEFLDPQRIKELLDQTQQRLEQRN